MNISNNHLQLVRNAQLGDADSISQLALLVRQRIFLFLYRATLDHDLSQDLLQDTFLAMFTYLQKVKKLESFWPWIYRIAWSKLQQHYRTQHLHRTVTFSTLEQDNPFETKSNPNPNPNINPLKRLLQKENIARLHTAVKNLPPTARQIVQLRCFRQLSYADIAPRIPCTPQQARIKFHRAKKSLKHTLLAHQ